MFIMSLALVAYSCDSEKGVKNVSKSCQGQRWKSGLALKDRRIWIELKKVAFEVERKAVCTGWVKPKLWRHSKKQEQSAGI
jgi:hypothetical protein